MSSKWWAKAVVDMGRRFQVAFWILLFVLAAGCSSLPGLRVLTGEGEPQTLAERAVEAGELVMADKTGRTDPAVIAAADRIEAASGNVDVVEIRKDEENRIFAVHMLFRPPQTDQSPQGQIAQLDALRRAFELTWQGTMRESVGTDILSVTLLAPQNIVTLDNGSSFIGIVVANSQIERSAAQSYLAGERSLTTFFDLIANGTLTYERPNSITLYEGTPNHPLFMLPTGTALQ